jgi:UDP-N-acetylmuramoylalanine--D-glutamate ligase
MRALVAGLGVSGRAAVECLTGQGYDVVAYDTRPEAAGALQLASFHHGEWDRGLLDGVDLVVPSPGIPETSRLIVDVLDSGVSVWSELELGYRAHADRPMLAVTGTNGKTTVTEIATAMLRASGIDAIAVGNIGDPISTARPAEALVVEASSFQLRFIDRFAPTAAAIVNFAPDHLDWHRDVAAYAAAKARIFEHAGPDVTVVYDADDAGAVGLIAAANGRLVGVSGSRMLGHTGRDGDRLRLLGAEIPLAELPRADNSLLVDLAIAAEGAAALGASVDGVVGAALSYRPGRHRREVVAEADGILFVDDSKATNPHAALAAIAAYPSVVLIAGGRAKGLDIEPLARAEGVKAVVAIGESAGVLVDARPDAVVAADMTEAVERAVAAAHAGDVVLLAPGCASFDMFDSYGHRGDVFAAAVRQRVGV